MHFGCRAEVVNGEVQVVGPSSGSQDQAAEQGAKQPAGAEGFEVPSQLRQQFIEVRLRTLTDTAFYTIPYAAMHISRHAM